MKDRISFQASHLISQEQELLLPQFEIEHALELGEIARDTGILKNLPIAIEVKIEDWMIYHASLPGSSKDNQEWIDRKSRVVSLKHHSTLYERISAQERKVDWFKENGVKEESFAIHGGGLPLITINDGFVGALLISGLPHIDDHLFGVEILTKFLARNG